MTFVAYRPIRGFVRLLLIGITVSLCGSASSGPRPQEANIARATLANGLRVVVVRNTLAPVVATSVNYLVGSDEAPQGFPGTAHAQEHMMFRGSPSLTADQLASIGSFMGGNFNANTRESVTQYLFTVPAEDLDVALHVEAARMQGVSDSDAGWDQERGAIEQEVAQDLSNPYYVLYAKLRAILFAGTPYEHDALGTRASFDKTTAAMLEQFHDRWYAPNNAILVIVGDVDPQATVTEVKRLFGSLKPKTLPARPAIALKPAQATSLILETDRPTETQVIAMRMPGLDSADFPALEVLSDVLNNHRFDLYGLVPAGKAIDAEFALEPLPHAGLGYAVVSFPPNGDAKAVEDDARAILRRVAQDGVPADLVEAAKIQEIRQAELQKNSIPELASVWSDALALYGLRSPDDDLARINNVTVADVDRVARKYLDVDHAVFALMVPNPSGKPSATSDGYGGQESIALGEAKATELPVWAQSAFARLEVPASTLHPVVSTLSNGMTLIVQPEDVSDTVSIFGHIRNRPETEVPSGQEGVAEVLDPLFGYGTEHLDRVSFQQALDAIGASENAGADFAIKILSRDFDRGVALLADNELHPALPPEAFESVRQQIAETVVARNASPAYLARRGLRASLFPADDPSLRDSTPESVRGLTLAEVRDYFRSTYRPDLTTIVVIGNITPARAREVIEKYFGAWTAEGPKPQTDLPQVPPNRAAAIAVPNNSRVQDSVLLAQTLDLTRSDPDYYALELGNNVLGGGFYSSRLSIDLRKNSGLVYSVGSQIQGGRTRSVYFVQFASDPQNVSKANDIVVREIGAMQTTPVSAGELARTKALLLRRIPLADASIDGIAAGFLEREELNLPLDEPTRAAERYISLGPAEVQAAFQKWMRPADLARVSQGPAPN